MPSQSSSLDFSLNYKCQVTVFYAAMDKYLYHHHSINMLSAKQLLGVSGTGVTEQNENHPTATITIRPCCASASREFIAWYPGNSQSLAKREANGTPSWILST